MTSRQQSGRHTDSRTTPPVLYRKPHFGSRPVGLVALCIGFLLLVIFLDEGGQAVHLDIVPVQGLHGLLHHLVLVARYQRQVNLAAVPLAAEGASVSH